MSKNNQNDQALYSSGITAYQAGNIKLAIEKISQAIEINPRAEYLKDLGDIYFEISDFENAVKLYSKAILSDNNFLDAYYSLGLSYLNLMSYSDSVSCFEKVTKLNPNDHEAFYNLGLGYSALGENIKAENVYKKAIQLNPNYSDAFNSLGVLYKNTNNLNDALSLFIKAVQTNPNNAGAYYNAGLVLQNGSRFEDAVNFYINAFKKNLTSPAVIINLGFCYQQLNKVTEAVEVYKIGLQLHPDNVEIKFNLGTSLIKIGDFDNGFKLYESRINFYPHHKLRMPEVPKWNGTDSLQNKTIYVYCASNTLGLGDSIMFARYFPLLKEKGAKIICKVQKGLEKLFIDSNLADEIINTEISDDQVNCDYQIPFMSLPYVLGIKPDNVPFKKGYLVADKQKVLNYKQNYLDNDFVKIGIAWQTSNVKDIRTMSLENFIPLINIPGVKVYSLQKGPGVDQLSEFPEITDLGKTFSDFSDTLAAIENLDLIICTDTSVAHAAGGLGKPIWIALPSLPDWRWLLNTEKTIWFDKGKLFRQKHMGNWDEVISDIAKELEFFVRK